MSKSTKKKPRSKKTPLHNGGYKRFQYIEPKPIKQIEDNIAADVEPWDFTPPDPTPEEIAADAKLTPKERKSNAGRKPVVTPEIVRKLLYAFAIRATAEAACLYAGIGRTAYYSFLKKNPEFANKIEAHQKLLGMHIRESAMRGGIYDSKIALDILKSDKLEDNFATKKDVKAQHSFPAPKRLDEETAAPIDTAFDNFFGGIADDPDDETDI